MLNIVEFFRKIIRTFLVFSKILFVFVGIYYVFNYAIYSFTFNIPASVRVFPIINIPLTFIENIGMAFLIIPLTIVILSFNYPERKLLQITANFFSVGGNLFSFGHLLSKGLLEDYFKTRIFTIFNAPSFETKQKLFSEYFHNKINMHTANVRNVSEFQEYAQNFISQNWNNYVSTIKTLPLSEIKNYAQSIVDNIYISFTKNPEIFFQTSKKESKIPWTEIFIGLGCVLAVVVGYFVYYKLYVLGKHTESLSKEMVQTTQTQGEIITQHMASDMLVDKLNKSIDYVTELANTIQKEFKNHILKEYNPLALTVSNNNNHFKDIINKLREEFGDLVAQIKEQAPEITIKNVDKIADLMEVTKDVKNLKIVTAEQGAIEGDLADQIEKLQTDFQTLKTTVMESLEKGRVESALDSTSIAGSKALEREYHHALDKIKKFDGDGLVAQIQETTEKNIKRLEQYTDMSTRKIDDSLSEVKRQSQALSGKMNYTQKSIETLEKKIDTQSDQSMDLKADIIRLDETLQITKEGINNVASQQYKEVLENTDRITKLEEVYATLEEGMNRLINANAFTKGIETMKKIGKDNSF